MNRYASEAFDSREQKLFACVVRQYPGRPGILARIARAILPSLIGFVAFMVGAACVLPYLKGAG